MKQPNENEMNFIKSLEIHDVLLLESEHKIYSLFSNEKLLVDFKRIDDLNLIVEDDLIVFEVKVELKIFDDNNKDSILLESQAKFASIYYYDKKVFAGDEEIIKEFSVNFFRFSAITHILAFAREYFYSILIKSGYPRVTLPLIKSGLDIDAENAGSLELGKHNY